LEEQINSVKWKLFGQRLWDKTKGVPIAPFLCSGPASFFKSFFWARTTILQFLQSLQQLDSTIGKEFYPHTSAAKKNFHNSDIWALRRFQRFVNFPAGDRLKRFQNRSKSLLPGVWYRWFWEITTIPWLSLRPHVCSCCAIMYPPSLYTHHLRTIKIILRPENPPCQSIKQVHHKHNLRWM
jgi:hypothetical protein